MKVYYHDVTAAYPPEELKGLPGVPVYAGRVLASTMPEDVVILPQEAMQHLSWVRKHYDQIDLPYADRIQEGNYDSLRQYTAAGHTPSFFFFGKDANRVCPNQSWRNAVESLNSKNYFINQCKRLGIKVPNTAPFADKQELDFTPTFPVYAKKALSASGFGVVRCENEAALVKFLAETDVPFQLQEALSDGTYFLNVQYEVVGDALIRGPITNQVLEGNTHVGNFFPADTVPAEHVHEITDVLAKAAKRMGIQGVFAYDVAVTPAGEILPVECNPRWNGASYYSRVAEKLEIDEWESRTLTFSARNYERFELGELSYQKLWGGVIVVNWASAHEGKIGVLIAGSPEERQDMLLELRERLEQFALS